MEEYQQYVKQTPTAPRVGTVKYIAQIVAFLCEDVARWVSGSDTCANGGGVMVETLGVCNSMSSVPTEDPITNTSKNNHLVH